MIHTKELRSGNKLRTLQGQVITVQQILSNSVIYDSKIELNHEPVHAGMSDNSPYYTELNEVFKEADCQDLVPIPLSEDILRQFGFRNFLREQWVLRIGKSNFDWEFYDGKLRMRNAACLQSFQYLHQLQNFVFASAGHELEYIASPAALA